MAVQNINPDQIESIAKEKGTVLVDFWAPWCGPCRAFGPLFEQSSEKHTDVTYLKVNVDEHQEFAATNGIISIPTIWIFKDGVKVYDQPGSLNFSQLEALAG